LIIAPVAGVQLRLSSDAFAMRGRCWNSRIALRSAV